MKKIHLLSLLALIVLAACNPKQGSSENTDQKAGDVAHTSQNALNWAGMYKGVVPCADCEGIETILVLNADNTYLLRIKYLGKGDGRYTESTGSLTWNNEANIVMLGGVTDGPIQYIIEENRVIQLDLAGNRITGDLADNYILARQ